MAMYRDFVHDYPGRCIDVLKKYLHQAISEDREVTLLLMAAAGGFVMPYERLSDGTIVIQPKLDRLCHKKAVKSLEQEINQPIKNSDFFRDVLSKWRYDKLNEQDDNDADTVVRAAEKATQLSAEKFVSTAIKIFRHSIAHGNVLAIESPTGQIQDLVFVTGGEKRNGEKITVEFVVLTPSDLELFILKRCQFLNNLKMVRQQDALEALDRAAV